MIQRKLLVNSRSRGAVAVEFALVAPVLVLLLLLTTEFGIALYDQSVITNAAREGARVGALSTNEPPSAALQRVSTVVNNHIESRLISFDSDPQANPISIEIFSEALPGDESALRVRVSYQYRGLFLLGSAEKPFVLSSEAVMRYE